MKKILMMIIVIAGLFTASYRFLPNDVQHQLDAQLDKIKNNNTASNESVAVEEKKKYVLKTTNTGGAKKSADKTLVASAYIQRMENVQVQDEGRVVAVLSDDRKGSKHQRFIVRTNEDVSVLIAHNIDLAKRVESIKQGDTIEFYGEYVWNEKGGVVHWTHSDPDGSHVAGWLKHNGIKYQ